MAWRRLLLFLVWLIWGRSLSFFWQGIKSVQQLPLCCLYKNGKYLLVCLNFKGDKSLVVFFSMRCTEAFWLSIIKKIISEVFFPFHVPSFNICCLVRIDNFYYLFFVSPMFECLIKFFVYLILINVVT